MRWHQKKKEREIFWHTEMILGRHSLLVYQPLGRRVEKMISCLLTYIFCIVFITFLFLFFHVYVCCTIATFRNKTQIGSGHFPCRTLVLILSLSLSLFPLRHHCLFRVPDLRRGWRRGGWRRGRLVGRLRNRRERSLVSAGAGACARQPDCRHAGTTCEGCQGQPGRQSYKCQQR